MKYPFKYALLVTAWLLDLMLLNLSIYSADVGYIAFSSLRETDWDIYIIDTDGQNLQNLTNSPDFGERHPAWSPDGRFLAYHDSHKRNTDIYVLDLRTQARKRLTDHLSNDSSPAWSPDGKWIAFISNRGGNYDIYKISADGGNPQRMTRLPNRDNFAPAWSPDGKWIAFFSTAGLGDPHIYLVAASGKGTRQLTPALRSGPTWSPAGDEIAFPTSMNIGNCHIFIMNSMGKDVRQLTRDVQWDENPAWSPNGRWIAYASGPPARGNKTDIYVVDTTNGESRQLTTHPANDIYPTWVSEQFLSVSPSAEKITTLWGKLKQP